MAELVGQLGMFGDGAELGEDLNKKAFEDKFKVAVTTDDCYTPQPVYDAVAGWVAAEYGVDPGTFVRPFWPGGDYQAFEYPPGCVVVDNPPFSLLASIVRWYLATGVRFFLFAPTLTLITRHPVAHIAVGADVTYENGAKVKTSFVTDLEGCALRSAPALYRAIRAADDAVQQRAEKALPRYEYPANIVTAAMAYRYSQYGVEWRVERNACVQVAALDAQKREGKGSGIFGGAYLLNSRSAAERQVAERQVAERQDRRVWKLSPRELAIIDRLDSAREKTNSQQP